MEEDKSFSITEHEYIDKKEHLILKSFLFMIFYVLLNYFVLSNIYLFLGVEKNYAFTFLLVFFSLSYLIGAALLRYFTNWFSLSINVIGSSWLGIMVLSSSVLILGEVLVFFNVLDKLVMLSFAFPLILFLILFSLINASFTKIKKHTITNNKIKNDLRIVHVSDLHVGAAHKFNFLKKIIDKINDQSPDVVFITGDLIDGKHKFKEGYFNSLNDIKAPVFMVVGNHERMTGMDLVEDILSKTKVELLRNKKSSFDFINIIGIDDTEKPKKLLWDLNKITYSKDKFNILLFHRPKNFKQVASKNIDLMLTGHTHGGQIFPVNILLKLFYDKVEGLKKFKDSYLYVSPGTGWWGPPMRLGSRNEITIFDLKKP